MTIPDGGVPIPTTKSINLPQLRDEATSAGALPVNSELATYGGFFYTYDGNAQLAAVPDATKFQIVVNNHVAQISNIAFASNDLTANYQTAYQRLTDIITNGNAYTQAQALTAIVDEARVLRRLMRLLYGQLTGS